MVSDAEFDFGALLCYLERRINVRAACLSNSCSGRQTRFFFFKLVHLAGTQPRLPTPPFFFCRADQVLIWRIVLFSWAVFTRLAPHLHELALLLGVLMFLFSD